MLVGVEEGKSKQRARARNRTNGIRRTKTRKDDGSARDVEKEGQRKVAEERVGEKQVRKERPAVSSCDVTQVPHGRLGERRWAGGQCSCTLLYSYLDPVFHQVYLASMLVYLLFFSFPISRYLFSIPAIFRKKPPPPSFDRSLGQL